MRSRESVEVLRDPSVNKHTISDSLPSSVERLHVSHRSHHRLLQQQQQSQPALQLSADSPPTPAPLRSSSSARSNSPTTSVAAAAAAVPVVEKRAGSAVASASPTASTGSAAGASSVVAKSCCLCCWRCCKCNSNGISRSDNRSTDSLLLELSRQTGLPPPSLEEIRSWGDAFDKLMGCPVGRLVFKEFLRCEYSDENIMFYLACEELKKECDPSVVEERARTIYEDFISILSPREVSLDSRVREVVNTKMRAPNAHTFDEAQTQIYTLMHRDSYPRFVTSPVYKRLAQIIDSSRRNSTVN